MYSYVFTYPSWWWFIAETCTRAQFYLWHVILLCVYVGVYKILYKIPALSPFTLMFMLLSNWFLYNSFIPLACEECDDSLPFSGASSIPLCYVFFPATFLHQIFFHPLSPHLAIYFLVYLSILLFPNSYIILFSEFYFLSFSVHAQTDVIYLTLQSLL